MSRQKITKRPEASGQLRHTSDVVWAVIGIASFPTVALSLAALGWKTYTSFIMACVVTLAILLIEALVRGKIWIFQKQFEHIFNHQETPFRVLVVAGGALLVLETLLLIQFFQNPAMDRFILNMVAKKQCSNRQTPISHVICPLFERPVSNRQNFALIYSLEAAAKSHLMPTSLAGSCVVRLLNNPISGQETTEVKFFTYCQTWQADACQKSSVGDLAIINAQLSKNSQGFFTPTAWQEDKESNEYKSLVGDNGLQQQIERELFERCLSTLKKQ